MMSCRKCFSSPLLVLLFLLLRTLLTWPQVAASTAAANDKYTSSDDVSWAITHDKLAYPHHQELYNNHITECNNRTEGQCQHGEDFRLRMNAHQPAGVYNFTQLGFQKIRIPDDLWNLLYPFWEKNKDKAKVEWKQINPYHNMWDSPPYFVSVEDPQLGGGPQLKKKVWNLARPIMEEWTGQRLTPVSMYGVRIYKNNSILAPHVDRMPLVTSCIINLEQDLDEDWPLEVFGHDGIAHNVTMEPGDMILYESHSVIHGRPFPMRGRSFVNVFLHFEPIGPLDDIGKCGPQDGLPPYLVPGGSWEEQFWKENPRTGWKVPDNPSLAIAQGDIRALEYMAHHNPEKLLAKDYNGWAPIHEAAYGEHLAEMKFLFEHGAKLEDRTGKDNYKGHNVLQLARKSPYLSEDHEIIQYLLEMDKKSEL